MPALPSLPRGPRTALAGTVLLVVAAAVVTALVLGVLSVVRWLWPARACEVAGPGGTTVHLSQHQAGRAARLVARAGERGKPGVLSPGERTDVDRRLATLLHDSPLEDDDADARVVRRALTGADQGALSCTHLATPEAASDRLGDDGLVPRAEAVRRDLAGAFGDLELGGFAPGGVRSGHMKGSAHYEGRAIDVFFRPITPAHQRQGWALAQYLVAGAERLDVATVIFDDRIWTAERADQGWREYRVDTRGEDRRTARILEHRDHVHVDVAD